MVRITTITASIMAAGPEAANIAPSIKPPKAAQINPMMTTTPITGRITHKPRVTDSMMLTGWPRRL